MLSSIISGINELIISLSNGLKQNFYNYCELETAMDNYTIVANNGSLLTILTIDGIKEIISGTTYYNNIISRFASSLTSSMEKTGHTVQSCFHYNPLKSEILIDKMLKTSYETAKKLDLDLEYMLDAQREVSRGSASEEKNFLLIWSNTSLLSKQDAKTARVEKVKEYKESNLSTGNAANPFIANYSIYKRHTAFVESTLNNLNSIGVVIKPLDVNKAIREVRMGIDEETTSETWEPFLPGDKMLPTQMRQYPSSEEWDVMAPKISQQVCNKDAIRIKNNIVKVGNIYYAPIYIDLMPKEITFFYSLFMNLIQFGMPWRILYTISGDGMASIAMKSTISQVLGFSSNSNKLFNNSAKYLKNLIKENKTIVKFQIALCTWADTEELAMDRVSKLARGVESWGSCNVSEITGNPISGLASSSMGFTQNGIATVSAALIEDAITMLPLSRPSSLWDSGGVILKSPDGKLLPYQPMSTIQETWITLIFAGPGSGKSMFTNMTNIALCLSPGVERIPRISIIDIGPSSKGFIELMKDALPTHQKHYAVYTRIENTSKYSINPFDIKVGCRFPFAIDRQYMINMVTLLMTDPGKDVADPGVSDFVAAVIDKTFEYYSDSPSFAKAAPKKYTRHTNNAVDMAIKKLGIELKVDNDEEIGEIDHTKSSATWYEVVDILAENGFWHEATLAQRYAVPTLADLNGVAMSDDSIADLFGKFKIVSTGEAISIAFNRMISSAIRAYPLLSGVTTFDLGESRIISLDLDQVAKQGNAQANRQTAIMYMYAMKLISGDFFLDVKNVDEVPFKSGVEIPEYTNVDLYKAYHTQRITEIKDDKKRLSIDEFHRTSKTETVRDQVLIYMREGRKWGVEIILASQSIDDFDDQMIEFATSIFVLSAGKNSTVDNIVKKLGVNDAAEIDVLRHQIRGPQSGIGNVFLAKFTTKGGNFTQLLNNRMGPIQLWSLSTTVADVKIRELIFAEIGSSNGRKLLATAFPRGSAANEVENRQKLMTRDDGDVYQQIVGEILNKFGPKYGYTPKELGRKLVG